MPVRFQIPAALRGFSAGREQVDIGGSPATVGEALEALWVLLPGIRDRVVTEEGQIRSHVNVFLGDENVRYTGGLATPVSEGAEILIFHAVSGG